MQAATLSGDLAGEFENYGAASRVVVMQGADLKMFEVERLREDLAQGPVLNGVRFGGIKVQYKLLETTLLVNVEPNFVE